MRSCKEGEKGSGFAPQRGRQARRRSDERLGLGAVNRLALGVLAADPFRVEHVRAVGSAAAVPVGIAAGTGEAARRRIEQGFAYVAVSNDAPLLGTAVRDVVRTVRPSAAPPVG
jgi:hypothetical protein